MIGTLIVTHGRLAVELLAAVEMIAGKQPAFRALALDWAEGLEPARARILEAARELDDGSGVLVLTDMYGDTPTNAALALVEAGRIEVVSGVNLPMLVRLACARGETRSLAAISRWLEIKGRRSIRRSAAVERGPLPSGEDR